MARNVRVKLDSRGLDALLAGREVTGMIGGSAERVAAAAGRGFEADTWISPTRGTSKRGNSYAPRVVGGVRAETFSARVRNSRDNILLRARDAGRT